MISGESSRIFDKTLPLFKWPSRSVRRVIDIRRSENQAHAAIAELKESLKSGSSVIGSTSATLQASVNETP